ncbi:MAG: D-aminoacyl-tRNA deacylase [Butyrivibrio sp.]
MKIVLQRVTKATVTVDDKIIGSIDKGLLIFLGVEVNDTEDMLSKYVDKIIKLRIFEDENHKTNLSLKDVNGSLLVVSQFTLCADCSHGNRPGFTNAKAPAEAREMYEKFISLCKEQTETVEHGEFGADMKVSLVNDGPFTILL